MSSVASATDATHLADEHAEMLATKWWTVEQFKLHGVSCREGDFTFAETEQVQDALRQYQTTSRISQEDLEDLILGVSKRERFWEGIARAVPGRRVRSVHDHAQLLYNPYRNQGPWTEREDLRLRILVTQHLNWVEISGAMRRSASACRNRFQRHLALRGTRRSGAWTTEEVALLHEVMQAMEEEGKSSDNTPKFWKVVSVCMDNTRTRDQCRDKWCQSLSPAAKRGRRIRWREADSRILFNKIALLNLDAEKDINWVELSRSGWNGWSAEKLQKKWANLKMKAMVDASATHRDIVHQLTGRWGDTPS